MNIEKIKEVAGAILGGIGVLAAIAIGAYVYFAQNTVPDPTSKPSCDVSSSGMISLINKYRTSKGISPMTEVIALDKVAKNLSDSDASADAITYSTSQITQATSNAGYQNSANVTYQVFPSSDSTVDGYIFKEMQNTGSFNKALLDSSTTKMGVYSNCSTTTRTVTVQADNPAQSNINGQQFKVNTLTYLVYDQ